MALDRGCGLVGCWEEHVARVRAPDVRAERALRAVGVVLEEREIIRRARGAGVAIRILDERCAARPAADEPRGEPHRRLWIARRLRPLQHALPEAGRILT